MTKRKIISLISALGNVIGMLARRVGLIESLPDIFQDFILGVPRQQKSCVIHHRKF